MSSSNNNNKSAIVVGAGLAGLAVSLSLVQKGYKVDLVERKENFDSKGATFGLAPNGQVALAQICPEALEYLKSIGILLSTGGYMLPWWEVRDVLLERVRNNTSNITLHMGLELESIQDTGNKVHVNFSNSDIILTGNILIGADGVHSKVRQLLGNPPAIPTGASVWRGRIHNVDDNDSLSHLLDIDVSKIYGLGSPTAVALFNFHSKLPGTIAWVVSSKAPPNVVQRSDGTTRTTTPLDLLDGIENDDDKATIAELLQQSDPADLTFRTELCVVDLSTCGGWGGKGLVTLIGDAAHALRPASGLGGSLAFEDSVILADMLSQNEDFNHDHDLILRKFEERRLPRCKAISEDQTRRSESTYKKDVTIPPWSKEFVEWLNMGPNAPSHPPKEEEEEDAPKEEEEKQNE